MVADDKVMLPGVNNLQFGNGDEISNGASRTTGKTKCICHAALVFPQCLQDYNVPAVDALQSIAADTDDLSWWLLLAFFWGPISAGTTQCIHLRRQIGNGLLAWTTPLSMFFMTSHFV